MSKANRKGRSKSRGKFVMLMDYTTNCEAWRDLKPAAINVYLLIAMRYNGANNGFIGLSVRDAARLAHIAPGTAQKAFQTLQDHGFIKCRKKGAFSVKHRHASEWELTCWSAKTGKPATHDYRKWKPPEKQNTVSRRSVYGVKTAEIIKLTGERLGHGINS